ncbi:TolC family protein [Ferrimonas senticii]|uniref:TolC family protein n=1 Tax=Ferrimonas senticii TaxID=394566 RepID=UPI000413420E|nr:TolC family protein [Ferrimonas senticii]
MPFPFLRRFVTLILLAAMPLAANSQSLSLRQAWQQLDDHSALLAAERQSQSRAELAVAASDDLRLPSLSLNSTYVQMEKPLRAELDLPFQLPIPDFPSSIALDLTERHIYRTSLMGSFPLYAAGRIDAAQQVKQAEYDASVQQLQIKRREQFNLLVQRYYGLVLAKQNAALRGQQLVARETHLHHATLLEKQGQIAEVERLNAQVARDQAKVTAEKAEHQVTLAQLGLDSLLQLDGVQPQRFSGNLTLPALAPLQQQLRSSHPALLLFEAKQRQAKGAVAAEQGRYKPTVGLFGSYTLADDDSLLAHLEPEWFVGIRFSMPLFTNDGRSHRLQAAHSAEKEAQLRRQQTQQDLLLLLQSEHQALSQAISEYQAYQSTISLAAENRRLRELAFQQGLATSLQLVDADQSLTAAKLGQAQAQYHYLLALAKVLSLSGELNTLLERAEGAVDERS